MASSPVRITTELPLGLVEVLDSMASRTQLTRAQIIHEAVATHLGDLDDLEEAIESTRRPDGTVLTFREAEQQVGGSNQVEGKKISGSAA